ncbi:MAG: pyrimidine-nucleoside phosphorylase [Candidatus Riflebacteria bacterium]|nr:pyrimidine-nucleoside phosphorylase [Candidatus Riflebacteria bacterium]
MRTYDIIKKKRDGQTLVQNEIQQIIEGYVQGTVPDYQMSAFLMAVFLKGMTDEETFHLTDTMLKSGETVSLAGIKGFTVDKHSTGGVGDKTSLVLGPILAALDLKVAKLSGRGLGHTGGTIDKLESIKGFSCDIPTDKFIEIVNRVGVAIVGQTANLVPADKKMYALRDVTATVDSIPLIAASIMSKKLAIENKGLILDVKVGSGAFMKKLEDARELARLMVSIGKQAGRKVTAVLSNMDEPLGEMIGNSLEVLEAAETLKGKGPSDLTELVKILASEALLISTNRMINQSQASKKVEEVIATGRAFKKLVEMVQAQGGDQTVIENTDRLPISKDIVPLLAENSGFISAIECEEIGLAAMMLGAGRETKEAKIDFKVGLRLLKHVGNKVEKGEILAAVYVNPLLNNEAAIKRLSSAFHISQNPVQPQKLILDIVS